MKPIMKISLLVLFVFSLVMVLLNRYTSLYINNIVFHFILDFVVLTTILFLLSKLFFKWNQKMLPIVLFAALIIWFIKAFLTWGGDWKTQTILYRSKKNPNTVTIEFQMREDRFAFGYKKKVVKRTRILPMVDWVVNADTTRIDTSDWKKVNIEVNELKLPPENIALPSTP